MKIEKIMRKIHSNKESESRSGFRALRRVRDPRAVVPLIEELLAPGWGVRIAIAEALARLGEPKWMGYVKENDGDYARLAESMDPRIVNAFIKELKFLWKAGLAATALGNLNDPRAVEPLIKALSDNFGNTGGSVETIMKVRVAAAEALGKLKDQRAVEPLFRRLADSDTKVQKAAADALAMLGEPQWRESFKYHYNGLWKLLRSVDDPRKIDLYLNALCDVNWITRASAAQSLGEMKDRRAVEPLLKALADEKKEVIASAIGALLKFEDESTIPELAKALSRVRNDIEWYERKDLAVRLIKLAKSSKDKTLLSSWIIPRFAEPHLDELSHAHSSDCSGPEHIDQGIGLTPEDIRQI